MVLVAEDVRREYGDTVAVGGVSLSVDAGEVYALVGPNGAGKTTLVRALTGTTDAEGTVELFGTPPGRVDRDRIGLLPQSFSPADRLTARELIDYYGGLYDDARDTASVIDDVGLAGDADTWYEKLSGGQQRRACVGTALVNDPDLLFLDEPTTGVDPAGRRALWDLLDSLVAGGTTVFLTTHDMAEAERLADRVGLLSAGALVAEGAPGDLVAEHGGDTRLVVETDAPGAAAALREAGYRVEEADGEVHAIGIDPREVGAAAAALEDAGVGFDALAWREPDLEDVYMTLAGAGSGGTEGREDRGAEA